MHIMHMSSHLLNGVAIMSGQIKKLADKWRQYFPKNLVSISAKNDHTVLCEALNMVYDTYREKNFAPGKILDVGCGDGYSLTILRNYYPKAELYGITINPKESSLGETSYALTQGKHILIMDMHNMDFDDNTFDTVYCRDVLEHSISPLIALYEMNRVMKKDALLFLIIPDDRSIENDSHVYVLNDRQLRHIVSKAGFVVESYSFRDYSKFNLGQNRYVLRKKEPAKYNQEGY